MPASAFGEKEERQLCADFREEQGRRWEDLVKQSVRIAVLLEYYENKWEALAKKSETQARRCEAQKKIIEASASSYEDLCETMDRVEALLNQLIERRHKREMFVDVLIIVLLGVGLAFADYWICLIC